MNHPASNGRRASRLAAPALATAVALGLLAAPLLPPAAATTVAAADVRVRIVHAAKKTPALVLHIDGKKTPPAVTFRKSGSWVSLPSGSHKIEVFPAKGKKGVPLLSIDAFMLEGSAYTVVACQPPPAEATMAFLLHDRAAAPADASKVRFFHAAGGLEWVGAYLSEGKLLGDKVPYGSATEYVTVAPGKATMVVRSPLGDETITFPPYMLQPGKHHTLVAVGPEGDREGFMLSDD